MTGKQEVDLSDVEIEDSDLKQVVTGCTFTEGPAADAEGNLFFRIAQITGLWCYVPMAILKSG